MVLAVCSSFMEPVDDLIVGFDSVGLCAGASRFLHLNSSCCGLVLSRQVSQAGGQNGLVTCAASA